MSTREMKSSAVSRMEDPCDNFTAKMACPECRWERLSGEVRSDGQNLPGVKQNLVKQGRARFAAG